jgi:hypothetical protein
LFHFSQFLRVAASSDRTGDSAEDPPVANRHTIVTDQAPWLDRSWYRNALPAP